MGLPQRISVLGAELLPRPVDPGALELSALQTLQSHFLSWAVALRHKLCPPPPESTPRNSLRGLSMLSPLPPKL